MPAFMPSPSPPDECALAPGDRCQPGAAGDDAPPQAPLPRPLSPARPRCRRDSAPQHVLTQLLACPAPRHPARAHRLPGRPGARRQHPRACGAPATFPLRRLRRGNESSAVLSLVSPLLSQLCVRCSSPSTLPLPLLVKPPHVRCPFGRRVGDWK